MVFNNNITETAATVDHQKLLILSPIFFPLFLNFLKCKSQKISLKKITKEETKMAKQRSKASYMPARFLSILTQKYLLSLPKSLIFKTFFVLVLTER